MNKHIEKVKKEIDFIEEQNSKLESGQKSYTPHFRKTLEACAEEMHKLSEKEGFSGCAHSIVTGMVKGMVGKALQGKCLHDIYDEPDRWNNNREYGGDLQYQHKDDSRFFKTVNEDGSIKYTANCHNFREINRYYSDGSHPQYTGGGGMDNNFPITLPISHKEFTIDVVSWEPYPDYWSHIMVNPEQVKPMEEYYKTTINIHPVRFRKFKCWFFTQYQNHWAPIRNRICDKLGLYWCHKKWNWSKTRFLANFKKADTLEEV